MEILIKYLKTLHRIALHSPTLVILVFDGKSFIFSSNVCWIQIFQMVSLFTDNFFFFIWHWLVSPASMHQGGMVSNDNKIPIKVT